MSSQWKLVPVEPTETMVINGFESVPDECFSDEEVWEQYQEMSGCQQAAFRAKLCWAAMLSAAPMPPQADLDRVTAERDALQLLLNQRDEQIETLKRQPQGEPVGSPIDYGSLDAVKRLALCRGEQPIAAAPIQEDRETLIGYGRSSALEEASTLCARLAYAAYYPPGTRFKAFTPKAQKALGDLLIKAANEIASLPGGPYERFKARQAKKAESAKSR